MENMKGRESNTGRSEADHEKEEEEEEDFQQLIASLPKERGWAASQFYKYQGFWCPPEGIEGIIYFLQHFEAHDTDIVLATLPKSGTTWLKALMFAIANRSQYPSNSQNHPLLTSNPHDLVPFLELQQYADSKDDFRFPYPFNMYSGSPRLSAVHVPYQALPKSIKSSGCRIIYLSRNPYDTFISSWHFFTKVRPESLEPLSFDEAFDMFCKGVSSFGPFWDHALGYWKASLEGPDKVLFLTYEDMKKDINTPHLKRLAEFMGFPFSDVEKAEGVIKEISRLCSFGNMRELEVNKTGKFVGVFENKTLFRRGEVGDWINYLTPEMVQHLSKVTEEKLGGSGLTFNTGF